METLTKNPGCPVDDDKKLLTSFKSKETHSLYFDTGIEAIKEELDKVVKKTITVFLVDDDLMYLTAMKHYLLQEIPSLKIHTFQTGESSLQQIEKNPDIIILDYYLDSEVSSAENGIKILKKIKHFNPTTKVVMLSCQDEHEVEMNSIKNGAFDYISKGEKAFARIKYLLMNLSGNNDFWID